ncbi:MAG TPA: 50S ribosomal protein L13 [Candidatus Omnitrophota bacterium]|nr:50S ribosomal protein L13 [Candidatus Omnitrophota bacterium]
MANATKIKKKEEATHKWYVVDVKDMVVGRASCQIAKYLMGKNDPSYVHHVDSGAGVIVLNCDKIRITGNKANSKMYKFYSGYPDGLKEINFKDMMKKNPKYIIEHAVKGMLPKTKMADKIMKRLKLYVAAEHPHAAQKPEVLKLNVR